MNTTAKRAVAACITAIATMAVAASAATAAPATFSPAGGPMDVTATTQLVVKVGTTPTPATTYTCTSSVTGDAFAMNLGGYGYLSSFNFGATCINGLGQTGYSMGMSVNTSQALRGEINGGVPSLTGYHQMRIQVGRPGGVSYFGPGGVTPPPYSVAWTNGTIGGSPSTATFNNSPISTVGPGPLTGQPITLTGTLAIVPIPGQPFPLILS